MNAIQGTSQNHLAGQLGVALADSFERDRMLLPTASGWVRRSTRSRALVITAGGQRQLLAEFAITL